MNSPKPDAAPPTGPIRRELSVLDRIGTQLGRQSTRPREGETWFGDDAAVLASPPPGWDLVLCSDTAVAGVHLDLDQFEPEDLGWRAVATTLSDLAAMGARPRACVVSVSLPSAVPIEAVMKGARDAANMTGCAIVGGDSTSSSRATVSCSALGEVPKSTAVLRSGASPQDQLYVTGPLGGSAAGLRHVAAGLEEAADLVERYRRPVPLLAAGWAAREAGVTAMIDVSDGLGLDLDRLCRASHVGVELDTVPVASGATFDEALGGGDDYELLVAVPPGTDLVEYFDRAGIAPPLKVGRFVGAVECRLLQGQPFEPLGYQHPLR